MDPNQYNFLNETIEKNFTSFSEWIFSLSGLDYTIAATTIAILLSTKLNSNQQNSVGNFFFLIGQALITMNAQDITQNDKCDNPTNLTIGDLNRKIEFLYQEILKMKKEL